MTDFDALRDEAAGVASDLSVLVDIVDAIQSGGGGGVQSVVAGTNVTVDDTDPANPIVSASGGGSAAAFHFDSFVDDTDNVLQQSGGTINISEGAIWSAVAVTDNDQLAVLTLNVQLTLGGTTGSGGNPIVLNPTALMEKITGLAPTAYDPPPGPKGLFQGQIGGVPAVGILFTSWNAWHNSYVPLCDFSGSPILTALQDGDVIYFNATWLIGVD